ncbi:S41 family peptidase [Mycoplasmatota bacterium zrk1]
MWKKAFLLVIPFLVGACSKSYENIHEMEDSSHSNPIHNLDTVQNEEDEEKRELISKYVEDLEYLRDNLPELHKDINRNYDVQVFVSEMNRIIERANDKADEIFIKHEVMKELAKFGDSHTNLIFRPTRYFPIRVSKFDSYYYITATTGSNPEILNSRIVAINGLSLEEVSEKFSAIVSHESSFALDYKLPGILHQSEYWKMITDNEDFNTLEMVLLKEGKIFTYELKESVSSRVTLAEKADNFITRNETGRIYWQAKVDEDVLYIKYSKCKEDSGYQMEQFVEDVKQEIHDNSFTKIIIDLRDNGGGNSTIISPLLSELENYKNDIDFIGLINLRTYSSGMLNSLSIKGQLDGVLIGEPIGQKPDSFGDILPTSTPNNLLDVFYSTKYFQMSQFFDFINESDDTLYPDIHIRYTFDDYVNGSDSILEYAINYKT